MKSREHRLVSLSHLNINIPSANSFNQSHEGSGGTHRRSSDIGRSAIGRYRSNYPRTIKHDRCELTPAAWNFVVSLPRWDLQRWSSKRESNRNRLVCPACLRSPSGDRGDLLEWEKKKEMSTPNRWKSREVGISFPTDVEFSHDFRLNVRGLPVQ
mgnify:CR=1 FL=1